jgi:hypothetical protein
MRGVVARARLVELQLGDAIEVADVAGQQAQLMVQRSRRDQQIEIRNELASAAQLGADPGKAFHNGVVEREHSESSEETAKARELSRGVGAPIAPSKSSP